mmetsp:Transcript_669/g.869  ORF Transcript_669/g.869 Transcript_669/m.869 type:complete len:117 (+) Transcript_669:109-459(+)
MIEIQNGTVTENEVEIEEVTENEEVTETEIEIGTERIVTKGTGIKTETVSAGVTVTVIPEKKTKITIGTAAETAVDHERNVEAEAGSAVVVPLVLHLSLKHPRRRRKNDSRRRLKI